MTLNPYHTLGLAQRATPADIKAAYRKLARKYHPDSNSGLAQAEDRFKEISNAYSLLSDPIQRRKYDDGEIDGDGHAFARSQNHAEAYSSYRRTAQTSAGAKAKKSRFNSFFKDHKSIKAKGANVSYTLNISFLEAAAGVHKTVRMTTGKTLKVQVPAGTEYGQVLRLKNQGMMGMGGGLAGDALVEIKIIEDTTFKSEDLDVYSEEAVTLSEALLGGRIEARTIHGPVIITVPEGSNSGTKLRLKGRGLQRPKSTKRGDHYVTLKVVLPQKGDADLKRFVKKWAAKKPYSVRKETLNTHAAE
ncbi:MAG: molecular chaperone DnaJ [Rhodospirillaceae bacterium]|nr:MAG: molecular chaperone DnaJ [Rhodospirillaceae bacterium]